MRSEHQSPIYQQPYLIWHATRDNVHQLLTSTIGKLFDKAANFKLVAELWR